MEWVLLQIKDGRSFLSPPPPPPPPPPPSLSSSHFNNQVSPSMLLIIIILAIIFFVSGLLHLLVRFLLRPPNRGGGGTDEMDENDVTALQGQLQQLFHLHDAGVDQSFIDTLPVFNYKAVIGVKDPFDCAVCLCEFEAEDNLRLLPKCSHAFHVDCIDTWLLSHSTCPLCRASLLHPDFPHCSSPMVLVLESGSETASREMVPVERVNSNSTNDGEIQEKQEAEEESSDQKAGEKVVSVKLGKFRSVDNGGEEEGSSEANADARRCFSMGSFAYVMDESSSLQVPIRTPVKKQSSKKPCLPPLTPGHRAAMSECGCGSTRGFNGFDAFKVLDIRVNVDDGDDKSIGNKSKKESFSVSKIWLRGKKDRASVASVESSRRAFSSRFAVQRNPDESKGKNGGSEVGCDEEMQRCDSLGNQPSFGRGTLLWLMGRQNKVVDSSFPTNV